MDRDRSLQQGDLRILVGEQKLHADLRAVRVTKTPSFLGWVWGPALPVLVYRQPFHLAGRGEGEGERERDRDVIIMWSRSDCF